MRSHFTNLLHVRPPSHRGLTNGYRKMRRERSPYICSHRQEVLPEETWRDSNCRKYQTVALFYVNSLETLDDAETKREYFSWISSSTFLHFTLENQQVMCFLGLVWFTKIFTYKKCRCNGQAKKHNVAKELICSWLMQCLAVSSQNAELPELAS